MYINDWYKIMTNKDFTILISNYVRWISPTVFFLEESVNQG